MTVVPDSILADAAFQMLASSTIKRYLRVAREAAVGAGLVEAVRGDPAVARASVLRTRVLWAEVGVADTRPPGEFELALLLVALADARPDGAESLFTEIASSPDAPATWTVWLARRLRQLGAPLQGEQEQLEREIATVLSAAEAGPTTYDPRLEQEAA